MADKQCKSADVSNDLSAVSDGTMGSNNASNNNESRSSSKNKKNSKTSRKNSRNNSKSSKSSGFNNGSSSRSDNSSNDIKITNNAGTHNSTQISEIELPPHWFLKQSRSLKGRIFYANKILKKVTWSQPEFIPCPTICIACINYQVKHKLVGMQEGTSVDRPKKKKKKKLDANLTNNITNINSASIEEKTKSSDMSLSTGAFKNFKIPKRSHLIDCMLAVRSPLCTEKHTIKENETLSSQTDEKCSIISSIKEKIAAKCIKTTKPAIAQEFNSSSVEENIKYPVQNIDSSKKTPVKSLTNTDISQNDSKYCDSNYSDLPNKRKLQKISKASIVPYEITEATSRSVSRKKLKAARTIMSPKSRWDQQPKCNIASNTTKETSSSSSPSSFFSSEYVLPSSEISVPEDDPKHRKEGVRLQSTDSGQSENNVETRKVSKNKINDSTNEVHDNKKIKISRWDKIKKSKKETSKTKSVTNIKIREKSFWDKIFKLDVKCKKAELPLPCEFGSTISNKSEDGNIADSTLNSSIDNNLMEIDDVVIATELTNIRKLNDNQSLNISLHSDIDNISVSSLVSSVHIVVDTNILISNLPLVSRLSGTDGRGRTHKDDGSVGGDGGCGVTYKSQAVVVVVPYTALQELDGLKKRQCVQGQARAAIRWCNASFSTSDVAVRGQSYNNYMQAQETFHGTDGDDRIRDCCLFLQRTGLSVLLLSNDVNLRNKALMADVSAINSADIASDVCSGTAAGDTHGQGMAGRKIQTEKQPRRAIEQDQSKRRLGDQQSKKTPAEERSKTRWVEEQLKTPSHNQTAETNISLINYSLDNAMDDDPMEGRFESDTEPKTIRVTYNERNRKDEKESPHILLSNICENNIDNDVSFINYLDCSSNSPDDILVISLTETLGNILEYVMKKEYGKIWMQIVQFKPPWSLNKLLIMWKKHWLAVFMDKFPSAVQDGLQAIQKLINNKSSKGINRCDLQCRIDSVLKYFNEVPYRDMIKTIPIKSESRGNSSYFSHNLNTDFTSKQSSNTTTDEIIQRKCLDQNANKVEFKVSNKSEPFSVFKNGEKEQETTADILAAKELIMTTGNRMKDLVTQGLAYLAAEGPDAVTTGTADALRRLRATLSGLAAAILCCDTSTSLATTAGASLGLSIIRFWSCAAAATVTSSSLAAAAAASSPRGVAQLVTFAAAADERCFRTTCLTDLRNMLNQLDAVLSGSFSLE